MISWSELVGNISGPAMLALAIYTGARQVWMFRWQVDELIAQLKQQLVEMEKDRNWWRNAYWELQETAKENSSVAKAIKDEVVKRGA